MAVIDIILIIIIIVIITIIIVIVIITIIVVIATIFIIVVVIFAVCWCPIQLVLLLKSLNCYPMAPATLIVQITSHTLAYTNSCVNPILYGFFSENFRKSFRRIFGRLFNNNNITIGGVPASSKMSKRSTSDVRLPMDKTDIEMKPIG